MHLFLYTFLEVCYISQKKVKESMALAHITFLSFWFYVFKYSMDISTGMFHWYFILNTH